MKICMVVQWLFRGSHAKYEVWRHLGYDVTAWCSGSPEHAMGTRCGSEDTWRHFVRLRRRSVSSALHPLVYIFFNYRLVAPSWALYVTSSRPKMSRHPHKFVWALNKRLNVYFFPKKQYFWHILVKISWKSKQYRLKWRGQVQCNTTAWVTRKNPWKSYQIEKYFIFF